MMDGRDAGPDGSPGRRAERADSALRHAERRQAPTSGTELDPVSARDAWELEREHLVVALHDRLRNPLACLQGYVELLLDGVAGPVAAEQQALLERMHAATTRLATAVEEIVPRAAVRKE